MSENIQSNIYTISVYQLQRCSSSLKPPNANGSWSVHDRQSTTYIRRLYPLHHSVRFYVVLSLVFLRNTSAGITMGLHTVDAYPQGALGELFNLHKP
jgi:hypothetical protein